MKNFLKCFLAFALFYFLFLPCGVAMAGVTPPEGALVQWMDDVSFLAVDDDSEIKFTLSEGQAIFYDTGLGWTFLPVGETVTIDDKSVAVISLMRPSNSETSGTLVFYPEIEGDMGFYRGVSVYWNDEFNSQFSIFIPDDPTPTDTKFAPVPIPATVWLLGTGLMAIFGIRRKSV